MLHLYEPGRKATREDLQVSLDKAEIAKSFVKSGAAKESPAEFHEAIIDGIWIAVNQLFSAGQVTAQTGRPIGTENASLQAHVNRMNRLVERMRRSYWSNQLIALAAGIAVTNILVLFGPKVDLLRVSLAPFLAISAALAGMIADRTKKHS